MTKYNSCTLLEILLWAFLSYNLAKMEKWSSQKTRPYREKLKIFLNSAGKNT